MCLTAAVWDRHGMCYFLFLNDMNSETPNPNARPSQCFTLTESFSSADFDFRHHLYSALILLGCKREIAELLKKSLDGAVRPADVEAVRRYCIDLEEGLKNRLRNVNTLKVQAAPADECPPA